MSAPAQSAHSARVHDGSPVEMLYRHALQSIFGFCSLADLHTLLSVSREWSGAVDSMAPIRAIYKPSGPDLSPLATSRLSRHLIEISGDYVSSPASSPAGLELLVAHLPGLEKLWFRWQPEHGGCELAVVALSQLLRIKTLVFDLCSHPVPMADLTDQQADMINRLVAAAGCLLDLDYLSIDLLAYEERIRLEPLAALSKLRTLYLHTNSDRRFAVPFDTQVAALRQLHSLERIDHGWTDRNGTLRLLLRSPIPFPRLEAVLMASGASDLVPQLQSLSALTELSVTCRCGDVDFVASLPQVTTLSLHTYPRNGNADVDAPVDVTRIVTALQRCSQLTTLSLSSLAFTSEHLSLLLPSLPQLFALTLEYLPALTSLRFLETEALAASLCLLTIRDCTAVPDGDRVCLSGLRSLVCCDVNGLDIL